ncbi:MAG: cbb3-type cytochrome c oxidase subunit 3 [Planctomycetes bacterium]|nr:cbb3-type cytochrome c oxidase subunit 3 [Planctomycetota bacterium]
MFKELLSSTSLFSLPVIATCIFVTFFVAVLIRVAQRARRAEYDHMSTLPLDDDTGERSR